MTHSKTLSLLATFALTSALAPTLGCGGSKADTATPEPAPAPAPVAQHEEPAKPPAKPIPDGYFSITPQLTVKGVDEAVDFYVAALGAEKLSAMPGPDGKTMHAEIKIGDSVIMLDEENVAQGMKSPLTLGASPGGLMAYVDDVDAVFASLTQAGATVMMPPEDQFWGDRYAAVVDPFGHRWSVATHLEELSDEQMMQRAELAMAPAKKGKAKAKKKGEPAWKKVEGTPATAKKPPQYHTVTPALIVADAAATMEFYKAAFGATELSRMPGPDGRMMHAEVKIGDSIVMLTDEFPEHGQKSATTAGGSALTLHLYTEGADAVFTKATDASAQPAMPMSDAFWGDRYGAVVDPAGYTWGIATHVEDLTEAEMAERMQAQMAQS